jgi:hypothetical protein
MIYKIRISLQDSNPEIWRELKISPDILLPDFHKVIQTTMGWKNCHMHSYRKRRLYFGNPDFEDDYCENKDFNDYKDIPLRAVLKTIGSEIIYEYDPGDGWEHDITLLKIMEKEAVIHPVCTAGKQNCPPENCGGIIGFYDFLEILKDENHEQYEEVKEWMDEDYDPEYFNLEGVR